MVAVELDHTEVRRKHQQVIAFVRPRIRARSLRLFAVSGRSRRSRRESGPFTTALLDLGQNSAAVKPEFLNVKAIVEGRNWNSAFVVHLAPRRRTFYDTDGDGTFDLIVQDADGDGMADLVLEQADGKWGLRDHRDRPLLDPSLIRDDPRSKRLRHILSVMRLL